MMIQRRRKLFDKLINYVADASNTPHLVGILFIAGEFGPSLTWSSRKLDALLKRGKADTRDYWAHTKEIQVVKLSLVARIGY